MAKPTNTIGDRDYGRRTYVSDKKYEEQRKLASDAHIDRVARRKHSEYKKPYLPDESYPEMETYDIPWDPPKWPRNPPDDPIKVDPGDPGGPVPIKQPPDTPLPPFLGCNFWRGGGFKPNPVAPGKYSIGKVWIGNEDYIESINCVGPGVCSYGLDECNKKEPVKLSGYKAYLSGPGSCTIVVWADASPDPRKGNTIVITAKMRSGMQCATTVDVNPCPAEEALEWDYDNSASTISRSSSAVVDIKGGMGSYKWSVSGTGFSMLVPKTSTLYNTLLADANACGVATITVKDACNEVVIGEVRCTTGSWVEDTPPVIRLCGMARNDGDYVTAGKYKMLQYYKFPGLVYSGSCVSNYYPFPPCDEAPYPCGKECQDVSNCEQCDFYAGTSVYCNTFMGITKCLPVDCSDAEWGEADAVSGGAWYKCMSQKCANYGYSYLWCLCTQSYQSWEWKC